MYKATQKNFLHLILKKKKIYILTEMILNDIIWRELEEKKNHFHMWFYIMRKHKISSDWNLTKTEINFTFKIIFWLLYSCKILSIAISQILKCKTYLTYLKCFLSSYLRAFHEIILKIFFHYLQPSKTVYGLKYLCLQKHYFLLQI